jgi:hypothetical protein
LPDFKEGNAHSFASDFGCEMVMIWSFPMKYGLFSTAVLMTLLTTCRGQDLRGTNPNEAMPLVIGILSRFGLSGSLEFSGDDCDDIRHAKDFPKLHAPQRNGPPLQDLREIFSEDPKLRITQDSDGTVRMVESDVPKDLLGVMIDHIEFRRSDGPSIPLDNPHDALWAILRAPEVGTFLAEHNIGPPGAEGLSSHASPDSRHISGTLYNVTLSQALDHLLLTFPGLWVYKDCPATDRSKRLFVFSFYPNGPGWKYTLNQKIKK